ncbi:MAG: ATP-grasp domain-containing protein [Chloroflexi bacterium]|nr:ATP-grasp domain-containing protein [Chloroflexota bacterium]
MRPRIAILYNKPVPSGYDAAGEGKAAAGVLNAVEAVHRVLLELGHPAFRMPLEPPLEPSWKILRSLRVDLVFNLFEGFCGRPETEALVPEALAGAGLLFTGSPGDVLGLAVDKARSKQALQAAGVRTPDFQAIPPETLPAFRLGYPCIVKPRSEDASHGLSPQSVVYDFASLETQVKMVSGLYPGGALVEEFAGGREFNATVLGEDVLPVSEIVYSLPTGMSPILTFAAKWEPESAYFKGTAVVCPAEVTPDERQGIMETARAACKALGCRDYARVDLRLDREGRLAVLEVNPNPDLSPDAGVARQALAAGMTYAGLIDRIAEMALERNKCLTSAL